MYFYFHVQNDGMVIGTKIENFFLHFSTFHDPLIPKTPKKFFFVIRPKSLNISRSSHARTLILVPNYFYIWGIDAINIFLELVGGLWSYPHFSLFWNFEKFQFFSHYSLATTHRHFHNVHPLPFPTSPLNFPHNFPKTET